METNSLQQEWAAAGTLTAVGEFMMLAISCIFSVKDSSISSVDFEAVITSGLRTMNCPLTGGFVVDPSTVGGDCKFTITSGSSGVSLALSGMDGTVYGTFSGDKANDDLHATNTGTLTVS